MSVVISFSNIIFAASGKDTLQGVLFFHIQGKAIKKGEREGPLFSTNLKSLGLLVDFLFVMKWVWGEWLGVRCLMLAKTILILCGIWVRETSPQLAGAYNHNIISLWKKQHCDFSRNRLDSVHLQEKHHKAEGDWYWHMLPMVLGTSQGIYELSEEQQTEANLTEEVDNSRL